MYTFKNPKSHDSKISIIDMLIVDVKLKNEVITMNKFEK